MPRLNFLLFWAYRRFAFGMTKDSFKVSWGNLELEFDKQFSLFWQSLEFFFVLFFKILLIIFHFFDFIWFLLNIKYMLPLPITNYKVYVAYSSWLTKFGFILRPSKKLIIHFESILVIKLMIKNFKNELIFCLPFTI